MPLSNLFTPRTARHRTPANDSRQLPGVVHVSSDELVRYRLQARELKLTSRLPARSTITGGHASRFRGRGMDYLESRDYQPGDDIRSMDWRVTARTNRAHVKLYQEERERPVVVMVDLGPGMFFATQGAFKSVIAARAAALMDSIPRPVPIINAGSGKDQHPTQALLDIYTLERSFEALGGIDGKTIGMMGDLKRGRTVRSLSRLMRHYEGVKVVFIAPHGFEMEADIKAFLSEHGIPVTETGRLHETLPELDAIYVTRIQSEHDVDNESSGVNLSPFTIGTHELGLLKKTAAIMHPLPRGPEIAVDVDQDPRAMYWRQERNGMWMRVALIAKLFGLDQGIRELASSMG